MWRNNGLPPNNTYSGNYPDVPVKSGYRQVRFSLDVNRARLELIPSTLGVYEPPVGRGFKGTQLRGGCSRVCLRPGRAARSR